MTTGRADVKDVEAVLFFKKQQPFSCRARFLRVSRYVSMRASV